MSVPPTLPPIRPPRARAGRKPGATSMTAAERAKAVTLWRAGTHTLADLAKLFKRRPETLSRLFKKIGAIKGSSVEETAKKMAATIEARALSSAEETAREILEVKRDQKRMISTIAKIAFAEIVRARQADLDLGKLKDKMVTLKLATDIVGNARKELYALLQIEESDKKGETDELPELTVRELTQGEVDQLAAVSDDDAELDSDMGADMLDLDEDDPKGGTSA